MSSFIIAEGQEQTAGQASLTPERKFVPKNKLAQGAGAVNDQDTEKKP